MLLLQKFCTNPHNRLSLCNSSVSPPPNAACRGSAGVPGSLVSCGICPSAGIALGSAPAQNPGVVWIGLDLGPHPSSPRCHGQGVLAQARLLRARPALAGCPGCPGHSLPGPSAAQHQRDGVARQDPGQAREVRVTVRNLLEHSFIHLHLQRRARHGHCTGRAEPAAAC